MKACFLHILSVCFFSINLMSAMDNARPKAQEKSINNLDQKLFHAVKTNNIDQAKSLVKAGANINLRLPDNMTLLMIAAINDNKDVSEFLLEQKIDINAQNIFGISALTLAAHNGNIKMVKLLLKLDAEVDLDAYDRLSKFSCKANQNHKVILKLLQKCKGINNQNADLNAKLLQILNKLEKVNQFSVANI